MKRVILVFLPLLLLSGLVSGNQLSSTTGSADGSHKETLSLKGMYATPQPSNVTIGESRNVPSTTELPQGNYTLKQETEKVFPDNPIILLFVALLVGTGALIYLKFRRSAPVTTGEEVAKLKAGRAFGISHVGGRENNEDNLLVLKLSDAYLLAVADGLGGHNAGEIASKIAVDTLKEVFEKHSKGMSDDDVKELLRMAYKEAHRRIKENAVGDKEGMGTTLVAAFVSKGKAVVTNTGDSRAYLIRDGKIVERTKDHSFVQELLDRGEITMDGAKKHPMRNIVTRALGVDFGVEIYDWHLEKGDVLLLSSDGLHDYVSDERIVEIASSTESAEDVVRKLINEALPVTRDNVTVVCLKI